MLVTKKRPPKLTLAEPPAVGIRPLAMEGADIAHAVGAEVILRGIDFELKRGQRIILRGPNGAGKSTLLNAVSGFVPSTGSVFVNGINVTNMAAAKRHEVGLGRGFQAARLYPELTVRESLQVALEARRRSLLIPITSSKVM